MRQTLFHIPGEFAGIPVFGFGWMLGAWALISVAILARLWRKQGWVSDTQAHAFLLAIMGSVIWLVLPHLSDAHGLPIRGYGVMLLIGVVAGVWMAAARARRVGVDPEVVYALAVPMFVAGIIGARLFYVIEYWDEYWAGYRQGTRNLAETLGAIVNVTQGGLVVFGSAIGAGIAFFIYVRRHGLPALALADLIAPSLLLGLALGRIGCFMNGCCFGGTCDLPWAVRFPFPSPPVAQQVEQGRIFLHGLRFGSDLNSPAVIKAVEPESPAGRRGLKAGQRVESIEVDDLIWPVKTVADAQRALFQARSAGQTIRVTTSKGQEARWELLAAPQGSLPIHPAQIYSAIDALLLCLLLVAWYPYRRRDGEVLAVLLTVHPVARFLLEQIRTDEAAVFQTGLSISQNLSVLMLLGGLVLWWRLLCRPPSLAWPSQVAMR